MFKYTSYFFSIKDIFVFVNNSIDLTGRNVDAELQKLFKDQRLRDIGMIILVQDIPDQIDVIVSLDMFRELACNILPGRGLPSLHAKTNIVWFDHKVLNNVIVIALKSAPFRNIFRSNGNGIVNLEVTVLLSFF